jgi:hypothetical protein
MQISRRDGSIRLCESCNRSLFASAFDVRVPNRHGYRESTDGRDAAATMSCGGVAAASPPSHPLPFFKAICPFNRLTEKEVEGLWLKDEGRNPFILQTSPVPPPV